MDDFMRVGLYISGTNSSERTGDAGVQEVHQVVCAGRSRLFGDLRPATARARELAAAQAGTADKSPERQAYRKFKAGNFPGMTACGIFEGVRAAGLRRFGPAAWWRWTLIIWRTAM